MAIRQTQAEGGVLGTHLRWRTQCIPWLTWQWAMPGNVAGNTRMPALVMHDARMGILAETYAADRGNDHGGLYEMLLGAGKHSAPKLRELRTQKQEQNKHRVLPLPWGGPAQATVSSDPYGLEPRDLGVAGDWVPHRGPPARQLKAV